MKEKQSTSGLWLAGLAIVALYCGKIADLDFFAQLRLGEIMLSQATLIQKDPFSFQLLDKAVSNTGWLAQLIFASIYNFSNKQPEVFFICISLIYSLILAICFVLPSYLIAKNIKSSQAETFPQIKQLWIVPLLGALVSLSNSSVRPQGFALLCFSFFLVKLYQRKVCLADILTLGLVALLWQNAHASLSLGVLLIFVFLCAAILRMAKQRQFSQTGNVLRLSLLALLVAAIQFATPDAASIFAISKANLSISKDFLGVSEWMPAWDSSVLQSMAVFWVVLLFSLGFTVLKWQLLAAEDFLLASTFTTLTLYSARFALFWAVAMLPLWIKLFCSISFLRENARTVFRHNILNSLIALGCILIIFFKFSHSSLYQDTPLPAIKALRLALDQQANIFNYREWSGPLVFAGSPQWRLFIDGRLYLYDEKQWKEYMALSASELNPDRFAQQYSIDAFFLEPNYQAALINTLRHSTEWKLIYEDNLSVVFISLKNSKRLIQQ